MQGLNIVRGTNGWQLAMPAQICYDLKDMARRPFQSFYSVDAYFLNFGVISFSLC